MLPALIFHWFKFKLLKSNMVITPTVKHSKSFKCFKIRSVFCSIIQNKKIIHYQENGSMRVIFYSLSRLFQLF